MEGRTSSTKGHEIERITVNCGGPWLFLSSWDMAYRNNFSHLLVCSFSNEDKWTILITLKTFSVNYNIKKKLDMSPSDILC